MPHRKWVHAHNTWVLSYLLPLSFTPPPIFMSQYSVTYCQVSGPRPTTRDLLRGAAMQSSRLRKGCVLLLNDSSLRKNCKQLLSKFEGLGRDLKDWAWGGRHGLEDRARVTRHRSQPAKCGLPRAREKGQIRVGKVIMWPLYNAKVWEKKWGRLWGRGAMEELHAISDFLLGLPNDLSLMVQETKQNKPHLAVDKVCLWKFAFFGNSAPGRLKKHCMYLLEITAMLWHGAWLEMSS